MSTLGHTLNDIALPDQTDQTDHNYKPTNLLAHELHDAAFPDRTKQTKQTTAPLALGNLSLNISIAEIKP